MPAQQRILLLAFPNGQLLDIAGPVQMFAGANDELKRVAYRIEVSAPQAGPFTTSSGVRLVADLAFSQATNNRLARVDTLMTVGGEPGMREQLADGAVTAIVATVVGICTVQQAVLLSKAVRCGTNLSRALGERSASGRDWARNTL
jgi:transcriptional regulator GlxA family with amidase domain